MSGRTEGEECPCVPLHIKCECDGHDCVGCAFHQLNYAVYNALNALTGGIVKSYHCPMFEPSGKSGQLGKEKEGGGTMTREEALKRLEQSLSVMKFVDDVFADCVDGEALEIVVEALKENVAQIKHGKWIDYPIADGCLQCSCCGVLRMGEPSNYCPNCGTKMDKEGQSDETN